jgi:hypothetical protein
MKRATIAIGACIAALTFAASAQAGEGVGWAVFPTVLPTVLAPHGSGDIQIDLLDTGASASEGAITVTDTLPPGLVATQAGGLESGHRVVIFTPEEEEEELGGVRWTCSGNGSGERDIVKATVVTCTSNPAFLTHVPALSSDEIVERIGIAVEASEPGSGTNRVTVAAGGATAATSASNAISVGAPEPSFGFSGWDVSLTDEDGTPATQAGSHPYEATFMFALNELEEKIAGAGTRIAGGEARTLEVELPSGFFGNPAAVPKCTLGQLDGGDCPRQSQIGVDLLGKASEHGGGTDTFDSFAVYNMAPPPGVPAEIAQSFLGFDVFLDAGVRSGHGDRFVDHIDNLPRGIDFDQNILTLWGVPAQASHDAQRGPTGLCQEADGCPAETPERPFLTLPTACAGPQAFAIRGLATWLTPDVHTESSVNTHDAGGGAIGFDGCEALSIQPSLATSLNTVFAEWPTELTANLTMPQEAFDQPHGLVASTLQSVSVALPPGMAIDPAVAAGLVACQEPQADLEGEGPPSCPPDSRVGTAKIRTPLLEGALEPELEGGVYVLQSDPPELKLLVAASADGVDLKLVANVNLDEATGQMTETFAQAPNLPVSHVTISFSGGAQPALMTPSACGTYTTWSRFVPWASPLASDASSTSSFQITAGAGGQSCSSPLPFAPSLSAGSRSAQAGAFTEMTLQLTRADGQQRMSSFSVTAPAGLTGMLAQVQPCDASDAAAGTCPASSQIGHALVTAGPGSEPLVLPQPGQPPAPIYLTGPYDGAPFGLAIAVPIVAGPFDLGIEVVRAKVGIDPHTAQFTVTTDPLSPMIHGVPTDVRSISAVIDREHFMLNPTSCHPSKFSGLAVSRSGTSVPISSRFAVGGCRSLKFVPAMQVSTAGHTSRKGGASLDAHISYPQTDGANASAYANIADVKVELPKQLPARLTTLQHACLASVFEANPATCPAASVVGHAVVDTPVLSSPLTGPAYFVSHGAHAFPDLVMVLQAEGVAIDLVGSTFVNGAGTISSSFEGTPDVPISSFDLSLPEGPSSVLAATSNLCLSTLTMPTEFTAQNGLVLHRSTSISVDGCPNALTVVGRSLRNRTLTLSVHVPSAGRIRAGGRHLSPVSATARGRETIRLVLRTKSRDTIATRLQLRFAPVRGRALRKSVDVRFPK